MEVGEYNAVGMFQCVWNWESCQRQRNQEKGYHDYEKILKDNLRQPATKLGLGGRFVFQHDKDPKHTSFLVKNYLQMSKVNILDWPAQGPDLNPIENL